MVEATEWLSRHWPWWAGGGVFWTCARAGVWLWQRKRPGKPIPVFGWLGDLAATKSLLILTSIQLKTARAKIARLEAEIEAAGIRSSGDASAAPSSDYPGSILARSAPPSNGPSASTSGKPASGRR